MVLLGKDMSETIEDYRCLGGDVGVETDEDQVDGDDLETKDGRHRQDRQW